MINLEKEEKLNSSENLAEDDLQSINRQKIRENTRIFIPCSELPNDNDERCEFLDSMVHFMDKETGKHYSYISANETELYEMKGFYIQAEAEYADDNVDVVSCSEYSANPDDSFEQAISENDEDKGKTAFIAILVTILIIGLIVLLFFALKQLIGDNDVIENTVQESAAVTSTAASDETSAIEKLTTILKRLIRFSLLLWVAYTCMCIAVKLFMRLKNEN